MSSLSETGHEKNAAHFEDLIVKCLSFGTDYNPTNAAMNITSLQNKLEATRTAIAAVLTAKAAYNFATNNRENGFKNLRKLASRVVSSFSVCGTLPQNVDDAKTILRKISGRRTTKLPPAPAADTAREAIAVTLPAGGPTPVPAPAGDALPGTRSVSQQSFEQLLGFFHQLIMLVSAEPAYAPHETDLQVTALQTLYDTLMATNTAVINASTVYKNAMNERNAVMYDSLNGLVSLALQVKTYIRSAFGNARAKYKLVSKLYFG